jgi:threonylcarbamoyladenosine tRNA methylthiotransferase MtaB
MQAFLASCQGRRIEVLMERETAGRTPHFAEIMLDRPAKPGSIVAADVTGHEGARLVGAALS